MKNASLVRGGAQLAVDAVEGVTDTVEGMYRNIAGGAFPFGEEPEGGAPGIAGLVHRCIRGANRGIGLGLDAALAQLPGSDTLDAMGGPGRDVFLAIVNGVIGDHLEERENPLAIPMQFRVDGVPLDLAAIGAAFPKPSPHLLVSLHGLCMNDRQWLADGQSYPRAAQDALGATAVDLWYNSGRPISDNGEEFSSQLQALVDAWPVAVKSIRLLGHSMGGLVSRSAIYYAEQSQLAWRSQLTHLVCLGSPHFGAPLERGGQLFNNLALASPYTAPLGRLGWLRSAGITDLRYGAVLASPGNQPGDRAARFAKGTVPPNLVPLPLGVKCSAVAASSGLQPGDRKDRILGDGLVPRHSALGRPQKGPKSDPDAPRLEFKPENSLTIYGINHWELLQNVEVQQFVLDQLKHG